MLPHLHYFTYRLNREVKEVYWHTFVSNLALAIVFIFEPIYLYNLGYTLTQIMWYYVQVYVWYLILVSFGAKFTSRFGYKHAIFVSTIFYVIYWIILFSVKTNPTLFFVAPLFFALQKSWFWPAYDADVSLASIKVQRGREVGVLYSLMQLAFIAGPFIGGVVSHRFGFFTLFILAAVLTVFSVYPLFKSPDIYPKHQYKFKNLLSVFRQHKSNFFGYFGYAEHLMVMSLWPIYIFIVVPSFFNVGVISTIATVIGTVLMLYLGKLTDKTDKRKLIKFSSLVYGVTWFFRSALPGVAGVLTFDVLTKAGRDAVTVPEQALTFERAAKGGPDYAIAYSVFYEFSLSVGKIVTALAAIAILSAGLSIFWVFALVGVMTMMYGFLR